MSVNTPASSGRLHTVVTIASSLLIAFPLFVSSLVKAALFAGNPAKVDITNGLAYLRELLGFGFGSLALVVVVIALLFVVARRRGVSLRLPLIILTVQIVVGVSILLLTAISNNAHDAYVAALGG